MSESRKVGLFVFLGLVLAAVLLLLFSKGTMFQGAAFTLRLKSNNVAGIGPGANVLLSGVKVGRVSNVELDPDGKTVTIYLEIFKKYRIYQDAQFEIEEFGFLGDQFVAIYPGPDHGRQLQDGDTVECTPPFNLQAALARASDTIARIGQATTNVNAAVSDVRRLVLTAQTLTNFANSVDQFSALTVDARTTVSNVNVLVAANGPPATDTISNLNYFSGQLTSLGGRMSALVATNEAGMTTTIKNIETASGLVTNLLGDLQTERGLAGRLVNDPQLADHFSELARNLSVTSSNLNHMGLWYILWRHKEARPASPSTNVLRAPNDPFREN